MRFLEVVSGHESSVSRHTIEYQSLWKLCLDMASSCSDMPLCYFTFMHNMSACLDKGMCNALKIN